jgi:hypothetical protein
MLRKSPIHEAIERVNILLDFNSQQIELKDSEVRTKICSVLEDVIHDLKIIRDTTEKDMLIKDRKECLTALFTKNLPEETIDYMANSWYDTTFLRHDNKSNIETQNNEG